MTTPPLDLTALRELAKAATPGPWEAKQGAVAPGKKVVGPRETNDLGRGPVVLMQPIFWDKRSAANADHIAAFNPDTAIYLLDRLEQAEMLNTRTPPSDARSWRKGYIAGQNDQIDAGARSRRDTDMPNPLGVTMSDYLHMPTDAEVRQTATSFDFAWHDGGAAFDRWVAKIKAEAWDKGWDVAHDLHTGYNDRRNRPHPALPRTNPYRTEPTTTEGI